MPIRPEFVDGVLLADKPETWTSHDVCAFIRKRFRFRKVGHAGTLDPLATGLLVILIGKATKYSMALSACDKEYYGTMELGVQTDSHDRQGKVIAEAPWEHVTIDLIREKARDFTGEIVQVPPMVSALKHEGTRLYKLARQGKTVPREGRRVTVHKFRFDKMEGRFADFSAHVSKGTYLRTLVNDLGEVLGCHACLARLRRLCSGNFDITKSVTIDTLRTMSLEELLPKMLPLGAVPQYANSHRPS
ncbi:MAG TPA: tRNA pseudouridine(55) synthase TruB [Candidatus Omnitrophota bacterium]|jgi:tRNA pseudouridine55 synthase|nr:tRNA pseudouridine(55) synthase TruB [Candidatus Omnitrophota bacterium]